MTKNELALKHHKANDFMHTVLNESIDYLNDEVVKETAVCNSESEELGTTWELEVRDKIEVYWPLGDRNYPGSVAEYSENRGKHLLAYDDG